MGGGGGGGGGERGGGGGEGVWLSAIGLLAPMVIRSGRNGKIYTAHAPKFFCTQPDSFLQEKRLAIEVRGCIVYFCHGNGSRFGVKFP